MNSASPGSPRWKIDLAAAEPPDAHAAGDPIEAGGVEPGEERHGGQGFGQWAGRDHEPHPTRGREWLPLPARLPRCVGWTTRGPSLFRLTRPACPTWQHPRDAERVRRTHDALTVIGSGTSAAAAGDPRVGDPRRDRVHGRAVDCGQGVIRELMPIRDPRELDAIIIGHMHADHYIDLVSLRYLMPWDGFSGRHVPVLLPPGGTAQARRARVGDQRATGLLRRHVRGRRVRPRPADPDRRPDGRVPARPATTSRPGAARSATGPAASSSISGDTGPNEALVEASRGADLFVVEATLLTRRRGRPDARPPDVRRGARHGRAGRRRADGARPSPAPEPRRALRRVRGPDRRRSRTAGARDRGRSPAARA